jgi:hypothetical protein
VAPGLRIETEQLAFLGIDADAHGQAERKKVAGAERVIMRPDSRRHDVRDVARASGLKVALEQPADERLDLDDRLARDIREDERLILALPRKLERRENRCSRVLAELRIDRA